ncbi:MAG TPA: response regulator, partial [Bryobacteraceae bacterium]|nr:response regulator [Bryobacteraceae bacterium]
MCRLLLVDDNVQLLDFYGLVLEQAGHQVRVAETCRRAIALLEETDPEIVVMDLRVPEMEDGLGLIRSLQAHKQAPGKAALKIVVTSGWTADLAGKPEKDSVDCILPKPVRMDVLLESISRLAPAG